MKKVVSILLCAAMLLSCVCMLAFAEDSQSAETVTITFKYDDGATYTILSVPKGKPFLKPTTDPPVRPGGEAGLVFEGWKNAAGTTLYSDTLPAADEDTTYTAVFKKVNDNAGEEEITFMSFFASILSRLNKIFAQIATYFEQLTNSIRHLTD